MLSQIELHSENTSDIVYSDGATMLSHYLCGGGRGRVRISTIINWYPEQVLPLPPVAYQATALLLSYRGVRG